MKNFIDEAIKALEELKRTSAIVENFSISYGNDRVLDENGDYLIIPDGRFEISITGYGLNKKPTN